MSTCALVEGVPGASHPLRRHVALKPWFASLDRAGADRVKNAAAYARIEKLLEPVYREAEKVFARPPKKDGATPDFKPQPARAFLERWVFVANAPLRLGRDSVEPAVGLAAAMMLAACRGGDHAAVVALGRRLSGPEAAAQRAFAALLLLEDGRRDEALELLPELGEDGFVAPYVAAELTEDAAERARLHELARRHVQTPDQETAWQTQDRRFATP